jgi:hypothetical protein
MSFESRKQKFLEITSRFECERPSPFLAIHRIRPDLHRNLLVAAAIFITRCMPEQKICLDDETLTQRFAEQVRAGTVWNCTPNGLLVPKRHLILEYNALVRAYINILHDMGIEEYILTLNPPSMRYKEAFQDIKPEKLARNYASEKAHLDPWTGDFAGSYNVSIPLFGDTIRNRVNWFSPPETFEESWLDYRPSYSADTAKIVDQYLPFSINQPYEKGWLYMADVAVLHYTNVMKGAGPRFTLDNLFSVTPPPPEFKGRLGPPYAQMKGIGETTLLVYSDTLKEFKENSPNKLPLDAKLIEIQ